MYCPNCGTQNPENSKFCSNCGKALRSALTTTQGKRPSPQTPNYYVPPRPTNPLASAATTGGLTGMAGGALIVLGWLLGGGLPILNLIFAGGLLGSLAGDEVGGLFVLLALALAAVVVFVPITGFLCAHTGVSLFELRAYSDQRQISRVREELRRLRGRATTILVMMLLMAAFVSIIPFIGQALLGRGYWLMVGGAVITFLGALFARSQLGPESVTTTIPKPKQRQLDQEEREVLWSLVEGLSDADIAERLGVSDAYVRSVRSTLFSKLGAEDTAVLIKRARARGMLPPGY